MSSIKQKFWVRKLAEKKVFNDILVDQIYKLNNLKQFPIFYLSKFQLQFQWIEYQIRQLIVYYDTKYSDTNMDVFNSKTDKAIINALNKHNSKQIILYPKDNLTFGPTIEYIKKRNGYPKRFRDLTSQLIKLNEIRKVFVHNLFLEPNFQDFILKLDRGCKLMDKLQVKIDKLKPKKYVI